MRISLSILDKRRKGGEGRKEDWDTAFFLEGRHYLVAQPVCYFVVFRGTWMEGA